MLARVGFRCGGCDAAAIMTATFDPSGGLAMIRLSTALVGVRRADSRRGFGSAPAPTPPRRARPGARGQEGADRGHHAREGRRDRAGVLARRRAQARRELREARQRGVLRRPARAPRRAELRRPVRRPAVQDAADGPIRKMGSGGPGYTIKAEFNKRPFERGVLGMARTNDPDSAGSQIYIMLGAAPLPERQVHGVRQGGQRHGRRRHRSRSATASSRSSVSH